MYWPAQMISAVDPRAVVRTVSENDSVTSSSFFTHPGLAIAFGAFILCAETCLHFESIILPASGLRGR